MAEQEQSSTRDVVLAEWRQSRAMPAHRVAPFDGPGLGPLDAMQGIAVLRGAALHPALAVRRAGDGVHRPCPDARMLVFPSPRAWTGPDDRA